MHNGGTIPIVSDGSARRGFQGHASDFSLLNKIMIIMEAPADFSLDVASGSPFRRSLLAYLAGATLFFGSR